MTAVAAAGLVRQRARVAGVVQGVGFRPFVYRLAQEEQLAGFVLNDERGVLVEVEGPAEAVGRLLARLSAEAPPLARVDSVTGQAVAPVGDAGFAIRESMRAGGPDALIAPDSATCSDCLAELFDPGDRRYRYAFTNCTNCGPRFTIVRGVPYDRRLTTMADFRMCTECQREYDDPADRRFHAQPNACPVCGPRVRLLSAASVEQRGTVDAVQAAAGALAAGAILAVKGIGGFHLACNASDDAAVAVLRARKHREDKPFALMVADADVASTLVQMGEEERSLLEAVQRPIVLAARRIGGAVRVADSVAPRAGELGLMLPYTPLHHLLLRDFACAGGSALVMTSGNISDEPIAYRDADALERLAGIADLFLVHDRPIETRTDDSVVRVVQGAAGRRPLAVRRSRGYVPDHLEMPFHARRPILACGAEQKNTFCLVKRSRAWVSHHIGDLEHAAALQAFQDGIAHFERLFAVAPEIVAHDLHPAYLSTAYAHEREGVELVGVQHHHAHLAACLAEHGLPGPAVGAIFDGTGYGLDGTVWGGELLVGGVRAFERIGRLRPVPMPGGAAAIREPWRMAFSWLAEAYGEPVPPPVALMGRVDARAWTAMGSVARSRAVSPITSSVGRLLDAIGALCGICTRVSYEGQAAVELEAAAARAWRPSLAGYEIELTEELSLDPRAAVRAVAADLARGATVCDVAARFHAGLADVTVRACLQAACAHGLGEVVLSGGVFQNRLLLESVSAGLARAGLRVLMPERLPPGDGGISFGQAAVAAARSASGGLGDEP